MSILSIPSEALSKAYKKSQMPSKRGPISPSSPSSLGRLILIESRLTPVTSQHALTTQHILIAPDGKSADVTTYFTGIHFGQGKWKGQQVTAWGKYVDHLICSGGEAEVLGASGKWRISRREVTFMGRLGEEGVMDGE
jgi:hypothetical protein